MNLALLNTRRNNCYFDFVSINPEGTTDTDQAFEEFLKSVNPGGGGGTVAVGALRPNFWELPLANLSQDEWEALCDGCGRCCLHKVEDEDTGEVAETNVACTLLDTRTARCRDYANRKAFVPDCLRLTLKIVDNVEWLPSTCAYRLRAAGRPLPAWHYLITGDREGVVRAGASVAGRVVSEDVAGPLEHHIVEWPVEELDEV